MVLTGEQRWQAESKNRAEVMQGGKKKKGKAPWAVRSSCSRKRRWRRRRSGGNGGRGNGSGGDRGLKPGTWSGRHCTDSGADRRAPHGLIIFQIFQN
jgi:hypothetical protein